MAAGDLVYFMVSTADAGRAQAFYGGLFDWSFSPGSVEGGFNVEGPTPRGGLYATGRTAAPEVWFEVDDIEVALQRVRELGGEADAPERIESGFMASCRDDQGAPFNLWAPKPG